MGMPQLNAYHNIYMENLHQLLLERHSIRRYTDRTISPEDVKTILEAGLLAPTSKSARDWNFIVVEDRDVLQKLSECKKFGTMPVKNCVLAVVVTSDPAKTDCFIEDASIAAIFMHLQAADLGIGSCWIQVRNRYDEGDEPSEALVQETLGIPADVPVECIMTFGYSAETRKPVDPDKLLWEKVHIGRWNQAQADD